MEEYSYGIITEVENKEGISYITLENEITGKISCIPFYQELGKLKRVLIGKHVGILTEENYFLSVCHNGLETAIHQQMAVLETESTIEVSQRFRNYLIPSEVKNS